MSPRSGWRVLLSAVVRRCVPTMGAHEVRLIPGESGGWCGLRADHTPLCGHNLGPN